MHDIRAYPALSVQIWPCQILLGLHPVERKTTNVRALRSPQRPLTGLATTRDFSASPYDAVCTTSGHFELYRCRYGRAKCSLDSLPPKGKPQKYESCVRHIDH
eukprot:scaffold3524_cov275-Pinguiococcus_pyrenoidosus.AAC.3